MLLFCSELAFAQSITNERLIPGRPAQFIRAVFNTQGQLVLSNGYQLSGELFYRNYFRILSPQLDTVWSSTDAIHDAGTDWLVTNKAGGYASSSSVFVGQSLNRSDALLNRFSISLAAPFASTIYNLGGLQDIASGLLEHSNGYFIPAFSGRSDRDQFTLLKTDTAGTLLWRKAYGWSGNDFPVYTCYTQDGNILMTGVSTPPPAYRLVVKMLLLNQNGDSLRSLAYAPFGFNRTATVNFNLNDRVLPLRDRGFLLYSTLDSAGGAPLPFLLKVNAHLQPQWTYVYRPPIGGGLRNNIAFSGLCELSDSSVLVLSANQAGTSTNKPYTLLRMSPQGRLLNTYPLLSSICAQVEPFKLLPDGDSAVYVFGRCLVGSPTFGEAYAARIRLRGLPGIVTATARPRAAAGAVALEPPYPNPATGTATVAYRRSAGSGRAIVHLTNMLGQEVCRWPIAPGGSGTLRLELAGLPAGVYLCTLRVPGWPPATRRLVVAP